MIRLSGLKLKSDKYPTGDIEVKITGLRPGEKLFEELLIGEQVEGTAHPRIMKASESMLPWPQLRAFWPSSIARVSVLIMNRSVACC